MIKFLTICLLLLTPAYAGEVLGIKYDQLYLVRLKASHKKVNHKDLLVVDGKQPKVALEAFKVDEAWSKRIDKIFPEDGDYDHGLADSRMQLFSLVFYREGNVVLSISPNLLGSDLYASNRKGYDSLSAKQMDKFIQTVLFIMSRCDKVNLPRPKLSEQGSAHQSTTAP